jgi:hypothetical protein
LSPIPSPSSALESNVPRPGPGNSSSENKISNLPVIESPAEAEGEDVLPRALDYFMVQDTPSEARRSSTTKISAVQKEITIAYNNGGFLDDGYVVELDEKGDPAQLGEATLFTAIAVIALAAGNYKQDVWEIEQANNTIGGFLTVFKRRAGGQPIFSLKGKPPVEKSTPSVIHAFLNGIKQAERGIGPCQRIRLEQLSQHATMHLIVQIVQKKCVARRKSCSLNGLTI